jgi:adenosine kinase
MEHAMDILLTGSVAYDYLMTFPGYFKEHILPEKLESISLSFLVDTMIKRRGGIAPNIAYTIALLGGKPRIQAAVGEDFEVYRRELEAIGIDTREMRVFEGFTASFFATTDKHNAQIASFHTGAMAHASKLSLYDLDEKPDLVVISPNDPDAMYKYVDECSQLNIPYLYDPSQQTIRMPGELLRKGVEGAHALFVNDYEFSLVQQRSELSAEWMQQNLPILVVTKGEQGASITVEGTEYNIPIVPTQLIVDPTGVGDAFRAGFLTGYRLGLNWQTSGQIGALCATYCLESDGTQSHIFTPLTFVERYREHFDDTNVLDILIAQSIFESS